MALDTNGQKSRYAEAARKWGNDPGILRALYAGFEDLAGVGGRYVAASADAPGLSIRSAHRAAAYFDFPYDIRWSGRTDREVFKLAADADVIHLTNDVKAYFWLRQAKARKPAVLHHHGTLFRNNPGRLLVEARRLHMVQAVSTIDLLRFAPDELKWLPTCYDLDELARLREANRRPADGRVRIVSAPTNREIKSTDALEAAVRELQAEGLPVDLVIVQGKTWAECLAVKATADIYFDQVQLGYGCNAIEAWGLGIPVVAGADDWTLDAMRREFGTKALPFMVATETSIADALRALVVSESQRKAYAARGLKHAQKFHAEKPVLERLATIYREAIDKMAERPTEMPPEEEFPYTPGTFRTVNPKAVVSLKNQTYVLRDGVDLAIPAPGLAQQMRRIARYNPQHGISEVLQP
jgi:hypothetical protein